IAKQLKQIIPAGRDARLIICADKFETGFPSKLERDPTPERLCSNAIRFLSLLRIEKLPVNYSNANYTWIRDTFVLWQNAECFVILRCVKQRGHNVGFATTKRRH